MGRPKTGKVELEKLIEQSGLTEKEIITTIYNNMTLKDIILYKYRLDVRLTKKVFPIIIKIVFWPLGVFCVIRFIIRKVINQKKDLNIQ